MRQQTIGTVARPVMRPVVVQQPLPTGYHIATGFASYHQGLGAGVEDTVWKYAAVAGAAAGAYHGYKRNGSAGWAVLWAVLGGISPVITTAVAVAQGFGKKKGH